MKAITGIRRYWKSERIRRPLKTVLMIVAAVIAALAVGSVFVVSMNANVAETYKKLLIDPFSSPQNIAGILIKATPILIVAVGVAVAGKAKLTNLGGEGQMYMGALGAILVGTSPIGNLLGAWTPVAGMLAGAVLGGLWGGIAGFFKARFKANEIITTLLLNYIAVQLIGFLVRGPLKEPGGLMPQSAQIDKVMRLPRLAEGMRAHIGIIIALSCVVLLFILLNRTRFGYNVRVLGGSPRAACYSGIDARNYYIYVMLISGAFAGFAGSIEVFGVQFRLMEGLAGGYGISGVVVALLGLMHPAGIVIAGLLMSSLTVGAELAQVSTGVPVTLVSVLQGMIVLFVLWGFGSGGKSLFQKLRKRRSIGKERA